MHHQDTPPLDPWVDAACEALGQNPHLTDTTELLELAGQVATAGLRPMAPVSAYLWGWALAEGRDRELARRVILDALPAEPLPEESREDPRCWQAFVAQSCGGLGLDPAEVPVDELPHLARAVAHASVRPMAPVAAFLLGLGGPAGLSSRFDIVLAAVQSASEEPTGNRQPQVAS
ncbi:MULTISPECIES: DUF6457 domain-containing protein [unclassified Luteococcus]|uniref:DUF6457 domain-containing protein n=1 Tax=unclassified Luteococcus TaxID=2639923 RepID=UPI00313A9203